MLEAFCGPAAADLGAVGQGRTRGGVALGFARPQTGPHPMPPTTGDTP
jgi:hypothetical protein